MRLAGARLIRLFGPCVQIARINHWFKNVFMLFGILAVFFFYPSLLIWERSANNWQSVPGYMHDRIQ